MKTYTIIKRYGIEGITCLHCGRTSFNSNDIQHKYCSHCKEYHEFPFLSQEKNLDWIKENMPELKDQ